MLTFGFMTDSYFAYKLLASIVVCTGICIIAGWGIYIWLGKSTKLHVFYRLVLTLGSIVAIVCALGLISERLGL